MSSTHNIFSRYKDVLLDHIDSKNKYELRFPLAKTRGIISNYTQGDFIVVGGRKTSGKSSFMLSNYVIDPLMQRINAGKKRKPFKLRVIYVNSRKNSKTTIERMVVNYLSNKNKGNKQTDKN